MTQYASVNLVNTSTPNSGTGDSIRDAFTTVNNNFSYLTSYTISNIAATNTVVNATTGARKFVANGIGTISNVWINLPTTGWDGQELQITSLTPITSCFVNQNGQNVLWLSNSYFSSGNVTATLTYTTSNSRWMKF